ncbi:hypothetical protein BJ508DRAFT_329135 [Ascobolus immersus RN42]|uniref:Uncharacterized protein n=1 Tax=Ascobolus immersus RN42 TaxID=1160509 RepID=A0A3N4I334_ASCIM|nr:hypothetical protein BJ508DRAFT_329135 [Ascobolus immersus RN42]
MCRNERQEKEFATTVEATLPPCAKARPRRPRQTDSSPQTESELSTQQQQQQQQQQQLQTSRTNRNSNRPPLRHLSEPPQPPSCLPHRLQLLQSSIPTSKPNRPAQVLVRSHLRAFNHGTSHFLDTTANASLTSAAAT